MGREILSQYTGFSSYRVRKALEELSQWLPASFPIRFLKYNTHLLHLQPQFDKKKEKSQ